MYPNQLPLILLSLLFLPALNLVADAVHALYFGTSTFRLVVDSFAAAAAAARFDKRGLAAAAADLLALPSLLS